MTDVQQAAPVAQEGRVTAIAIARHLMVQHFGPGKSSAMPADWVIDAMIKFASLPCKSGEGDDVARGPMGWDIRPHNPDHLADAGKPIDATQTREAELVQIIRDMLAGKAGARDTARAVLNARGGA